VLTTERDCQGLIYTRFCVFAMTSTNCVLVGVLRLKIGLELSIRASKLYHGDILVDSTRLCQRSVILLSYSIVLTAPLLSRILKIS
jgi:hypothetical protein